METVSVSFAVLQVDPDDISVLSSVARLSVSYENVLLTVKVVDI